MPAKDGDRVFGFIIGVHDQFDRTEFVGSAKGDSIIVTDKGPRHLNRFGLAAIGLDEHACIGVTQGAFHKRKCCKSYAAV